MDPAYLASFTDPTSPNFDPTGAFEAIVYGSNQTANDAPNTPNTPKYSPTSPSYNPGSPPYSPTYDTIGKLHDEKVELEEIVRELEKKNKVQKRKIDELTASNKGKDVEIEYLKKCRVEAESD